MKRTPEFQKNFDDFALVLQKRRDEKERLRAEKKALEESAASASNDAAAAEPSINSASLDKDSTEAAPEEKKSDWSLWAAAS